MNFNKSKCFNNMPHYIGINWECREWQFWIQLCSIKDTVTQTCHRLATYLCHHECHSPCHTPWGKLCVPPPPVQWRAWGCWGHLKGPPQWCQRHGRLLGWSNAESQHSSPVGRNWVVKSNKDTKAVTTTNASLWSFVQVVLSLLWLQVL